MPATVSISASEQGLSYRTVNAISGDGRRLDTADDRRPGRETSITFGERRVESVVRLLEACTQATSDDATEPITFEEYRAAEAFLAALPPSAPLPEVTVHPDGEIAFEWHRNPRRVLTVSVASDGSLAFAALFGVNTTYGRELFSGSVPRTIAHCLDRLYPTQAVA